jgi:hypothetical protein
MGKTELNYLGLVDRFFVPLSNRFIGTGSIFKPVYWNRFIQTGFYLGNRFKVNKKNINKRSKIKVKFKVFLGKLVPKLFL